MKKIVLIVVAASAVVLATCATTEEEKGLLGDPRETKVTVIGGRYLVVDQEPIPVFDKNVRVRWQVDRTQQQKYRFPGDGIVINDPDNEFSDCKAEANGAKFSCHNKNAKKGVAPKPRYYKYSIRLVTTDGSRPPERLDPTIMND